MKNLLISFLCTVCFSYALAGEKNELILKPIKKTYYYTAFYNKDRIGESVTFSDSGKVTKGYSTRNIELYNTLIKPMILENKKILEQSTYTKRINVLIRFIFDTYRLYIGKSFYRWGGDLFDLDDAQVVGVRHEKRYGLDCSGFVAAAYEASVDCGLLPASDTISAFAHTGFAYTSAIKGISDGGGRNGAPNRFRPDSKEYTLLGREIFNIPKNGKPTREQLALLQPGDIVSRNGHVGIVAFINGKPYYYESGGWAVPKNNGRPVEARKAIKLFARTGALSIRRALPDAVPVGK